MLISIICLVQGDILLRPLPVVKNLLRQTGKSTPCREISTPALLRPLPGGKIPTPPDREIDSLSVNTHSGIQALDSARIYSVHGSVCLLFPSFWPLHSSSCCRSAKSNIPLRFRKSRFHLSGHYTLPVAVVLQSPTYHCASESRVSIFLGVAH